MTQDDRRHPPRPITTRCRRCGRRLTAPDSVACGIGPVCGRIRPWAGPPDSTEKETTMTTHDDSTSDPAALHDIGEAVRSHLPSERTIALGPVRSVRQPDGTTGPCGSPG
jgi:hypothetical protein